MVVVVGVIFEETVDYVALIPILSLSLSPSLSLCLSVSVSLFLSLCLCLSLSLSLFSSLAPPKMEARKEEEEDIVEAEQIDNKQTNKKWKEKESPSKQMLCTVPVPQQKSFLLKMRFLFSFTTVSKLWLCTGIWWRINNADMTTAAAEKLQVIEESTQVSQLCAIAMRLSTSPRTCRHSWTSSGTTCRHSRVTAVGLITVNWTIAASKDCY